MFVLFRFSRFCCGVAGLMCAVFVCVNVCLWWRCLIVGVGGLIMLVVLLVLLLMLVLFVCMFNGVCICVLAVLFCC
jgi:hypothetical protein